MLLATGFLFEWMKAARARIAIAGVIYTAVLIVSTAILVGRNPLSVQEVDGIGTFSPNPQTDPRAQGKGRGLPFPMYASSIYTITNNTDETVTFQAILKLDLDDREHLLAALALGDRAGWSREMKAFFDLLFDSDESYLLSPVTLGARESARGRFLFRISAFSDSHQDELKKWAAAFDPVKPLDGTAYIDLRDFSNGKRLAEPLYLLSKREPD